jgi:hypothetical protein
LERKHAHFFLPSSKIIGRRKQNSIHPSAESEGIYCTKQHEFSKKVPGLQQEAGARATEPAVVVVPVTVPHKQNIKALNKNQSNCALA